MAEGKTVTTARIHLNNVGQFFKYFTETSPPSSRLTKSQQAGISRTLASCSLQLRKDIVLHQIAAKGAKLARVVPGPTLAECQRLARARIPELLGKTTFFKSTSCCEHTRLL